VAQLTKEPDDPRTELKIAIAGPVASGVLAGLFWLLAKAVAGAELPVAYAILSYLALINLVLLIFNLIPGFPLDGGRVLRALWWAKTGNLKTATKVASQVGKGFALFLILTGFFQVFVGNFVGGLWSVLIGFFIMSAAESGYRQLLVKRALGGIKVRDVMSTGPVSIDGSVTIAEAVDEFFFKHHFISFPVISEGRVVGLLTLNNVRRVEKAEWPSTFVRDAMTPLGPDGLLSPKDSALEALGKISTNSIGRAPVVEDGRLMGMVSRGDILRMLEFKTALER
jgi:CBS domain-containing protein